MTMPDITLNLKPSDILENVEQLTRSLETAAEQKQSSYTIETGLFKQVMLIGKQLMTLFLQLSGQGYDEAFWITEEGRRLKRSEKKHTKLYQSVFGIIPVERFIYQRRKGQKAEYIPYDAQLQLPEAQASYLLQEWGQSLATKMPYGEVQEVVEMMLGQRLSSHTLSRQNQSLSTSVVPYQDQRKSAPQAKPDQLIVVTSDGKGVPMCSGSKKMALVGAAYTVAPYKRKPSDVLKALFDKKKPPHKKRSKPIAKRVQAELLRDDNDTMKPSMKRLFTWLSQEVVERNPNGTQPVVLIMDGQQCLWDEGAARLGQSTIEILDLLHANGYLWKAAELFHKQQDMKEHFAKLCIDYLLKGEAKKVIDIFDLMSSENALKKSQQKKLNTIRGYLVNNLHRMKYDEYLAAGYPIASGVIEGACRYVVKDRMERSGMRWQLDSAQAMLSLRCVAINDEWQPYMNYHIRQENLRLYPWLAANDDECDVKKLA